MSRVVRDLILSSGYLAFARHAGFLRAVEDWGLEVGAVCGTSSGALVGALWAAGMPADEIARELSAHRPVRWLRPSRRPWRGLFSVGPLLSRLAELLPASFTDLERPLAVGVRGPGGGHELLTGGSLPEAVAASCAIPLVFEPVEIEGRLYSDGGAVDRGGLGAWREWRPGREALVHWIERTRGVDVDVENQGLRFFHSAPSGASFFNLGNFQHQMQETFQKTVQLLAQPATSPGGASPGGASEGADG